jgi:hypothetical protein
MKIYCRHCNSITKHRQKGLRNTVNICNECDITNMPVTIEKDNGETHHGAQVKFVEWNGEELGSRVKQLHEEPQVGFSVMLDPQYFSYTWLTTPIKEIESDVEMGDFRCITFKTQNSNYKLYISGRLEVDEWEDAMEDL